MNSVSAYLPDVPGYLGRVLDEYLSPIGTCFHAGAGIYITAFHVLDDLGVGSLGSTVTVDRLAVTSPPFRAIVDWLDPINDLALMISDVTWPEAVASFGRTQDIAITQTLLVTGVAEVDDSNRSYRYVQTVGTWQGGVVREQESIVTLGRMRCRDLMPGMSGAPVRLEGSDTVVGIVSGRYNSADGWLRDTAWVVPTEPLPVRRGINFRPPNHRLYVDELEDSPQQLIINIFHSLRKTTEGSGANDITTLASKLLTRLNHLLSIGQVGPGASAGQRVVVESADLIIDDVIKRRPDAVDLLVMRSRMREQFGAWPEALDDLQSVITAGGRLDDSLCLPAGSLLMTLGNYGQARRILAQAAAGEVDQATKLTSRQLTSWIDDYQGNHQRAIEDLIVLAREANKAGVTAEILGGIEHRIGRAMFALAVQKGSRPDVNVLHLALKYVEHGRARIGPQNPFGALWLSLISSYLDESASERHWLDAREGLQELGLAGQAHILVFKGRRESRAADYRAARQLLWDGLECWKRLGYPNGAFDSSLALGRLYLRHFFYSADDRQSGFKIARLASRLGNLMGSADRVEAEALVVEALDRLSVVNRQVALEGIDEKLMHESYGSLLQRRQLSVPE